ncbi:DMT family transporter [Marmoricola sp. RAF53]|uniref:DMT family transporter n=1 Tax=Marmoricola sp. RAF53 TaxID=3233059 RepID=UPI003F9E1803
MRSSLSLPTLGLLAVGVLAVSLAAPLMAQLAVPALAIAFWRNAMAAGVLVPVAAVARRDEVRGLARREIAGIGAAGLCLAVHFGTWITSLSMTSVASSTAIVSLQVIWVVGWDLVRGEPVPRRVLVGVGVATFGAVVVSGVDLSLSARALAGDGLALVGSVAVAAYAVIGGRVRQRVSTTTYTAGAYGTAAVVLGVAAVVAGQSLGGYPADQWAWLVLLVLTAQLLGHSVFNHLLATVTPTVVSLALLLEIPGAALIAGVWLDQVPGPGALVGLVLILGGMAAVILAAPEPEVEAISRATPPG